MSRFRIKYSDDIKAVACSEKGKLLATIYDSGFTTIGQVESALIRKIPFYSGRKISISMTNLDKEINKGYVINVN